MSNWFAGLTQAGSGINAARYGLSVVSQNIENADTDGYTEQVVNQAATARSAATGLYSRPAPGTALTGVTVSDTSRNDDPVLDARVRSSHAAAAAADTSSNTLSRVEDVLPEPSDQGLSARLSDFYTAWGAVATNPDSTTARGLLLRSASAAASTLKDAASALDDVATDVTASLTADVSTANTAVTQLSAVNGQLAIASATGQNANALSDQRDQLLDQLGKLVGGVATLAPNGTASVTVGGATVISGSTTAKLAVSAAGQVTVGGSQVTLGGGSAGARVAVLTSTLPGYRSQLDTVADALSTAGNSVQAAGYDLAGKAGAPLFTGSGAAGITVALTDGSGIAASATPGGNLDGSNALRASQLGTASGGPDVLYTALIGAVASDSAQAAKQQGLQDSITANVDSLHASVSGVSYDEEITKMLTYQHAFSASSRVLTTVDEMLDTLINHTGVVGRA